ncbi:MAG: polysaccharide pyruvyl transferase family protein [Cyclobacteriaceae bacterium]
MNANDICNSKCTMCNIWQQKQDFEVTPEQLEEILNDELYSDVTGVGITGGEPTLREDLPALYEACCKKLPSLVGLSIITNAIREKDVIDRIHQVIEVCKRYQKKFSIMVSLDGYGKVHDSVRGREGNFESALKVINHFRNTTDIGVAIGCTISKVNVWDVDELLDFLREENIYGRFRVAEFIKRLYNDDRGEVIRIFNEEERYHLMCFFKKLELTFEKNNTYRRTYRSIINILGGGERMIGCPYQDSGIVLNSRGELHYCAPKSNKIGNGLETSSLNIYQNNLDERQRILDEECQNCIHDYHASITYREAWLEEKKKFWQKTISLENIHRASYFKWPLKFLKSKFPRRNNTYKVLITGWYGTETVGDKAILGQIVDHYKHIHPDVEFYISSMHPFVTEKTVKELRVEANILATDDIEFSLACAYCDETVMGGGPLMGIDALSTPLWAFKVASMFKKKTVVFGCGIGPLKKKEHIEATKEILSLSSEIKVRDNHSQEFGEQLSGRKDIVNIGDPARSYVQKLDSEITVQKEGNVLACFLREWTTEYKGDNSTQEFLLIRDKFEKHLASYIRDLCSQQQLTPVFYPMHTFVVGNDDREFNRNFVKKYLSDLDCKIHRYNASVRSTVEAMKASSLNLCMRFHSVLFAHTLNTNFIAIDYTNGGKIKGYLTDHNATDRMISLYDLASDIKQPTPF